MSLITPNDIILREARKMGYDGDSDTLLLVVAEAMESGEPYLSDGSPFTEWIRELMGD